MERPLDSRLRPRDIAEDFTAGRRHSVVRAFGFSCSGLAHAFRSERAFRLETLFLALGVPLSFFVADDFFRRAALVAALLVVLAVELLNTGVEKLCDRMTRGPDPVVKAVKDMGSAAVLCSLVACALLWGGALLTRFS